MRWYILKYLPFGYLKIPLSNIKEIKPFKLKYLIRGGYVFGNIFTKRGVTLVLTKKIYFTNNIFITPSEPDIFINKINASLKEAAIDIRSAH
jgi:hypothetical protein